MGVFKRRAEGCAVRGEFGGERVRVRYGDKGIPAHEAVTRGVREGRQVFLGFDEDLRSVADEDGEEGFALRLLKCGFKAEFVAVEGDGSIDVADDKKWCNGGDVRSYHWRERSGCDLTKYYQR